MKPLHSQPECILERSKQNYCTSLGRYSKSNGPLDKFSRRLLTRERIDKLGFVETDCVIGMVKVVYERAENRSQGKNGDTAKKARTA